MNHVKYASCQVIIMPAIMNSFSGYEYCVESTSASWTPGCKTYHMCRRKRWVRPRSLIKGFKVEEVFKDIHLPFLHAHFVILIYWTWFEYKRMH